MYVYIPKHHWYKVQKGWASLEGFTVLNYGHSIIKYTSTSGQSYGLNILPNQNCSVLELKKRLSLFSNFIPDKLDHIKR